MRYAFLGLVLFLALFLCLDRKYKPAKAVQNRLPAEMDFSKILGSNRDEMIRSLESFPLGSYQLYLTKHYKTLFYLDKPLAYDGIKTHLWENRSWEPHIQKLIKKYALPNSTAIDLGAHVGTHTLAMARAVGPNGHVIAFEPQPKIFSELFLNMAINSFKNTSFYWAAAGEKNGFVGLSPLQEGNEGGTGLSCESSGKGTCVPVLTLDSLSLSNVSLIKIDVEGMENQVLEGARETILRNRPVILIEIFGGKNIKNAPNQIRRKILETIDRLEELDYSAIHLEEHDWIAFPNDSSPK